MDLSATFSYNGRALQTSIEDLKKLVLETIDAHSDEIVELSLKIHANPEVSLQEVESAARLVEYLRGKGFDVEAGICGLPTAFRASYGQGTPAIAFIAEYDALPGLGHACGHNIIAAAALGAAVGTRSAINEAGGTVLVIGTPGEELYGCKETMVAAGAFTGLDAAMMIHPGTRNIVAPTALACVSLEVEFFGKAAHAAGSPHQGINALEALILAFNNVNSLRQHIKERSRVHGIITSGGEAANIVPAYSSGLFLVRAEDEEYLKVLKEKVLNCFVGASAATGARFEHKWGGVTYAPLQSNAVLAELFTQNMGTLGRKVDPFDPERAVGSTDMGNVSQVVPSIHPIVAIAPPHVLEHSPEFAAAAASEAGHQALLEGAKALALTATDLLANRHLLEKVKDDFSKYKERGLP
ncbi:MAG: M20 family peptidase [Chloroflexi bacterium]|nr:MAG: M20 family peptidase [Chloroflexota bacterium]